MTDTLALALGHVRNAVWQLMGNAQPDGLSLGLECLDLEALLNPDDHEPAVVEMEADPAASLAVAARLLKSIPEYVVPAAWPVLASLTAKLG
jgi:hypothetical protein